MRGFIAIMLVLIFFALVGIENSIREASLSPAEKTQQIEQQKEQQRELDQKIKTLQIKKYGDVPDNQKVEWIYVNVISSPYFIGFMIFGLVFAFYQFITRSPWGTRT